MRDLGFMFEVTDNCGEDQLEVVVSVTSDEGTASASGAGRTNPSPDATIMRELDGTFAGVLLRRERSSAGDGRVYEIHVQATDPCGNVGTCSKTVSVSPANGQPAVDSGQFFDATEVN